MSSYSESVFVDKFGWGEDWQADNSEVVELIDISHLTIGAIHLLVTILRSSGLSVSKIFEFLTKHVLPSKVFNMNNKMSTEDVKCFQNKKVKVNLYGDYGRSIFLKLMIMWVLEGPTHQSRTPQVDLFRIKRYEN